MHLFSAVFRRFYCFSRCVTLITRSLKLFSNFKVVSLFSYQGSFVICSITARMLCLMKQLFDCITLFYYCQQLFKIFILKLFVLLKQFVHFRQLWQSIIFLIACQALFYIFFKFWKHFLKKWTEKEGFEPSRRVNDLHP